MNTLKTKLYFWSQDNQKLTMLIFTQTIIAILILAFWVILMNVQPIKGTTFSQGLFLIGIFDAFILSTIFLIID